jgi:lipopolysaccharide export system permease protein
MKVLDRYILRELFLPIFYCCLTLVFLILIADLFDNLDEMLRHHTPFLIFLRYYLMLIPYAFVQIIPWATWLGTLFLLVSFGFHNEMVAMKVAGLKIMTIIRPILFLGFLIGIVTFMVNDRLVPRTYRIASELREIYIEKKTEEKQKRTYRNVTYDDGGNHIYFFRTLSTASQEAEDLILIWLDKESRKTRQKISAKQGRWTGNFWEFEGVTEHQLDSKGRILGEPMVFPKKSYPEINTAPQDLANASSESIFLSYREMKRSMKKLKESGVKPSSELVDMQDRLASPWQSLVMMMITIPLLARTRTRKGIAASILICTALVFAYHVVGAIGLALGKAGNFFPFVSAWAGNTLFTLGAVANFDKANY